MLAVKITGKGLLDPAQLRAWSKKQQDFNRAAVAQGMADVAPEVKKAVRNAAASGLKVQRQSFLNVFKTKVWKSDPTKLPALQVYADQRKAPWIGIHETGGTISGRMVIPLLQEGQRIGRKKFAALLSQLRQENNLFFKREGSRTLIFAKSAPGRGAAGFSKFKSATRARLGRQRLARGTEILIGVIVSSVTLPARLGFFKAATGETKDVVRAIETALGRAARG